ncbi:hypothetical protein GYMLUDRAFT_47284 [Collybiopsis luxurians FD-317 M1]|uniref:Rho-GAP domain-containing protein n=1 Tax=Collybiopsis luxurians FD-317 M1 TaxID=944289 RepID=A0A0D0BMX4_9AGAR|nr:hypothetical protein GYMLUDRAFT_47284 [Collybiopsis luxurians FD-317 M1]
MASSRPSTSRTSLIPSPTRPRRSSVTDSKPSSPSKSQSLQSTADKARNRSITLPSNSRFPTSPNPKRTPKLIPHCSPSKLPRPSIPNLCKQHISLKGSMPPTSPSKLAAAKRTSMIVSPCSGPTRFLATSATPRSTSDSSPRRVSPSYGPRKLSINEPLHIHVPTTPLPAPRVSPRGFSKRDPRMILDELASLIGSGQRDRLNQYLPLDVMLAVHERELMEGAARLQRAKSIKSHSDGSGAIINSSAPPGVFGIPLRQISLYASTKAVLGGFEHDLPIVVFACVEELYRSGISTPSNPTPTSPLPNTFPTRRTLSLSPLDAQADGADGGEYEPRSNTLLSIYDSPSEKFGLMSSLKDESSDNVYALLTTFLSRLPEPVLAPAEILQGLRDALWTWCVKPSSRSSRDQSGPVSIPMTSRVRVAQLLLGLVPTPNLSLFIYLMAFSCQVLEIRMKRRTARESLAVLGGASSKRGNGSGEGVGAMSALEAQLWELERELEGKNEREREKRNLGRVWGVWLFGKDGDVEVEVDTVGDAAADVSENIQGSVGLGMGVGVEEASRSTQMMVWMVSHWGEIIRGFFDRGIGVDPEPLSIRADVEVGGTRGEANAVTGFGLVKVEGEELGVDQSMSIPVPLTESLFASSASLARLRLGVGVEGGPSPNSTPKQQSVCSPDNGIEEQTPRKIQLRFGLVRGQSYGKPTTPDASLLVPSETEQEGSIHSRYSVYGCRNEGDISSNESEMMAKEGSLSSVSALDERLSSLDFHPSQSHTHPKIASLSKQQQDNAAVNNSITSPSTTIFKANEAFSECGSERQYKTGSKPAMSDSESEDDYFTCGRTQSGPLRVVNRSDSDVSSRSDIDSERESVYSTCSLTEVLSMTSNSPVFSLNSREKVSSLNDLNDGIAEHGADGLSKIYTQCVHGCPAHLYVKQLEVRVDALMKENKMLKLSLDGA